MMRSRSRPVAVLSPTLAWFLIGAIVGLVSWIDYRNIPPDLVPGVGELDWIVGGFGTYTLGYGATLAIIALVVQLIRRAFPGPRAPTWNGRRQ